MKKIDKSKAIEACNRDTMTSLEVAKLTGMRHADLLRSINSMADAWNKVQDAVNQNERRIALVEYKDAKGEMRPMYMLNKEQWLYVATRWNNEARAILVTRWAQLEKAEQKRFIEREVGKQIRRGLTDALQESGENERMHGHAYSTYTNLAYSKALGATAKQLKKEMHIGKNDNLRDHLSDDALKHVKKMENVIQGLVDMGMDYNTISGLVEQMQLPKREIRIEKTRVSILPVVNK